MSDTTVQPAVPLTLGDFGRALAAVGIDYHNVASGERFRPDGSPDGMLLAPRLDVVSRADVESQMVLVVNVYALNAEGHRYFDMETGLAATETRRFLVTEGFGLEVPPDELATPSRPS